MAARINTSSWDNDVHNFNLIIIMLLDYSWCTRTYVLYVLVLIIYRSTLKSLATVNFSVDAETHIRPRNNIY